MRLTRKLCYLHFPKTAGTALATHLVPMMGDRLAVAKWQDAERDDLESFDWIHGHVYYEQIQQRFTQTPFLMTMLRHPIERIFSLYRFYGRKPELGMQEKVQNMTFHDFVEERLGIHVYLGQLTGKVHTDENGAPTVTMEGTVEQRIRLAKQRLLNFDYIGISEQFSYSTLLLAHDLGLEPMWHMSTANSAPSTTTRDNIEPETIELIKKYANPDIQIYNYANELFRGRIRKLAGVL